MTLLTRDAILAANDIVTKTIDVPEWGGKVKIRTLTGADRMQLQSLYIEDENPSHEKWELFMVALSIVDGDGNRIFSTKDVDELAKKSATAINRVTTAIRDLSLIGEEAIGEAEKNLEEVPNT